MYFIKRLRQAALGIAGLFSVPFGKKVEKSLSKIITISVTISDKRDGPPTHNAGLSSAGTVQKHFGTKRKHKKRTRSVHENMVNVVA